MSKNQCSREFEAIRERERRNKLFYDREDGVSEAPYTICLSVNNNCFMKCRMCDIGCRNRAREGWDKKRQFSGRYSDERRYREFPLERIRRLVAEMAPHQPTIKTNFVEPLLYKNLEAVVRCVKEAGLPFYTISNGWTLKKNARWLVEAGVDLVRVSLDGVAAVHDFIRGQKGSHQRVVEGLLEVMAHKKRLGTDRPILGLCCTLSNHNVATLLDFVKEVREAGLLPEAYVNVNHLQYTTRWEARQTMEESPLFRELYESSMDGIDFDAFDTGQLGEMIEAVREFAAREGAHIYFSPELKGADLADYYTPDHWMFPRTPCYLPWYAAQVGMDGEVGVYGHCILPSFGNIMERDFMEVWNSPEARDIRLTLKRAGSFPGCNRCIGTLYPLRGRN